MLRERVEAVHARFSAVVCRLGSIGVTPEEPETKAAIACRASYETRDTWFSSLPTEQGEHGGGFGDRVREITRPMEARGLEIGGIGYGFWDLGGLGA